MTVREFLENNVSLDDEIIITVPRDDHDENGYVSILDFHITDILKTPNKIELWSYDLIDYIDGFLM